MEHKYKSLINSSMSSNKVFVDLDQSSKDTVTNLLLSVIRKTNDTGKLMQSLVIAKGELKSIRSFENDLAKLSNKLLLIMLDDD